MADPPANTYDKDGQLVPNRPATLGELMGLVRRMEKIEVEMMSGRDEREATTERERRAREDTEEKARALDAEREADEDKRSLSTYAKERIADLEDERDAYRDMLEEATVPLARLHAVIRRILDRYGDTPCTD